MEDLTVILAELTQKNIGIRVEDDGLLLDGPVGSLTPDLKQILQAHKSDIIDHLLDASHEVESRKHQHVTNPTHMPLERPAEAAQTVSRPEETASVAPCPSPSAGLPAKTKTNSTLSHQISNETTLGEWLKEEPIRRIRSNVLEEDILIASDDAEIGREVEEVVYRQSEIKRLIGMPNNKLRAVHTAKKMLDGEIL